MTRIRTASFVFMVATFILGNTGKASLFGWETVFNECILQGGSIGPVGSWPVPDNRCGLRFELSDCYVGTLWDACKDLCESSTPVAAVVKSASDTHCECDVCIYPE